MEPQVFINNLRKGKERREVVVRVIRKWTYVEDQGQGDPLYIGMIFADAQGGSIYAEVPAQHMATKGAEFEVGKIYRVKKFNVKNAKPNFKVVENPNMLELSHHTLNEVVHDHPDDIPEYIYDLTPFPAIQPVNGPLRKYKDVIGYLTKYTELDTFVPKNKEKITMLRELYLRDLNNNDLKVTIWGDHAVNFKIDHIYDERVGNIIVCLIVGCAPRRDFKDYNQIYLSGSSPFSLYLNPRIVEAQEYYTRFNNTPVFIELLPRKQPSLPQTAGPTLLQLKTVADLNAIIDPYNFEDGAYKCVVTITSVIQTKWWYMACRPCKKKATQQSDGSYICPVCNGTNTAARYLLNFMASDDTAEARFFAHDSEAKIIVGRDCEAVMSPIGLTGGIPQQILNIVNKKYVFSIDLEDEPIRQYVVKAVLGRPSRRPLQPNAQLVGESSSSRSASYVLTNQDQPLRIPASVHSGAETPRSAMVMSSDVIPQVSETSDPVEKLTQDVEETIQNETPPPQSIALAKATGSSDQLNLGSTARKALTFQETSPKDKESPIDPETGLGETISDTDTHTVGGSDEQPLKRRRSNNTKQGTKQKVPKSTGASS